jgi:hypothetical protein
MKSRRRLRLSRLASATWRWSWLVTLPLTAALLIWAHATWTRWQEFGVRHHSTEDFSLQRVGAYEAAHLARALRVSLFSEPPARALAGVPLRQVHLFVAERELQRLNAALPASGGEYVDAALAYDGALRPVEVRYRGDNSYHWAHRKKSWRVKTEENRLFHTTGANGAPVALRRFNLLVPRTAELLNNHLAYRLAQELGVLAPHSEPVVVALNGAVSGVHFLVEQPEELTLRRELRMPGDLYSGEWIGRDFIVGAPPNVFGHPAAWTKMAINNHFPDQHDAPLRALLTTLEDTLAGRTDLAEIVDLDAFARFSAWEALVCTTHFDEIHNWRLYYDPWRRRFEPMAWDAVGWTRILRQRPGVDLRPDVLSSKLHVALHRDARFLRAKQRALRDFLAERAAAFLAEVDTTIATVGAALDIDPQLEMDLQVLSPSYVRSELATLREAIAATFEGIRGAYGEPGRAQFAVHEDGRLRLSIEGRRPVDRVVLVHDDGARGRVEESAEVRWSTNREAGSAKAAVVVTGERAELTLGLLPSVRARLASLAPNDVLANRLEFGPATYDLELPAAARPGELVGVFVDRGDGLEAVERVSLDALPTRPITALQELVIAPAREPRTWSGVVELSGFERFDGPLTIEPGTKVRLAPGASVEVRGRFTALGTAGHPIVFEPASPDPANEPWGALTITGRGADGSSLAFCQFRGGSGWKSDLGESSAMLSVHDVRDLSVLDTSFEDSFVVDDMVHVVYGDVRFERCTFQRSLSDALDLDMCTATVVGCRFEDTGNDGIDLMSSVARVEGCTFSRCGDKGASIGERTRVLVTRSKFEACAIGAQVKDDSTAIFVDVELLAGPIGVDAYLKSWRYGTGGRAWLERVTLSGVDVPIRFDKDSSVEVCSGGVPAEALRALGALPPEQAP